jgi:hypothetical protein
VNIEKQKSLDQDIILECPNCKVCSIKLSAEEFASVETGQQMLNICPVCNNEVLLNGH